MRPSATQLAPAYQVYAVTHLSDTLICSLEAQGAHTRLRSWSWLHGPIPAAIESLARVLGVPPKHAARLWAEIRPLFVEGSGGFIDPDLERQRSEHAAFRAVQSAKGLKSGQARRMRRAIAEGQPQDTPDGNRGSTAVSTGETPEGQPSEHSFVLSSEDQVQERDQDQRPPAAALPQVHEATYPVLLKLAHGVIDDYRDGRITWPDTSHELKDRARAHHLSWAHQPDLIRKALESALAQRTPRQAYG